MNSLILTFPLLLQALAMAADEGHFHRRRVLSRWERIGHPLDTLTVLACYALTLVPFGHDSSRVFVVFAVFSCVFVTKDEAVHHRDCSAKEQWLHAVLFMLHPIVLACVYLLWASGALVVLRFQTTLTAAVGLYQTLYWNVIWPRAQRIR